MVAFLDQGSLNVLGFDYARMDLVLFVRTPDSHFTSILAKYKGKREKGILS